MLMRDRVPVKAFMLTPPLDEGLSDLMKRVTACLTVEGIQNVVTNTEALNLDLPSILATPL
jgi:hypothetical protein